MKIINQRKISVLWHLICFSLVLAFTACSDDKEELQEYLTPASGSESIFEQGFSFGEAASSQSVSFEAGQQWTAELSGEDTGWCNISPAKGTSGKATIMVSVGKNETGKARTAQLNIVSGSKKKEISVTQAANAIVAPDGLSFTPAAPDADQSLLLLKRMQSLLSMGIKEMCMCILVWSVKELGCSFRQSGRKTRINVR